MTNDVIEVVEEGKMSSKEWYQLNKFLRRREILELDKAKLRLEKVIDETAMQPKVLYLLKNGCLTVGKLDPKRDWVRKYILKVEEWQASSAALNPENDDRGVDCG